MLGSKTEHPALAINRDAIPVDDVRPEILSLPHQELKGSWQVVLVRVQPSHPIPGRLRQGSVQTIRLPQVTLGCPTHAIPERLQDLHRLIVRAGILDDVLKLQAL